MYTNLIQEIEENGVLSNSFYEAHVNPIPRLDRDNTKKKTSQWPHENRPKYP